jgi:hypothetical protein
VDEAKCKLSNPGSILTNCYIVRIQISPFCRIVVVRPLKPGQLPPTARADGADHHPPVCRRKPAGAQRCPLEAKHAGVPRRIAVAGAVDGYERQHGSVVVMWQGFIKYYPTNFHHVLILTHGEAAKPFVQAYG